METCIPKKEFLVLPKDLRWSPDMRALSFKTTDELSSLKGVIIGQNRAVEAIKFGARVKSKGYNILAIGNHEMGRTTAVKTLLKRISKEEGPKETKDACLVHDFTGENKFKFLYFVPGDGKKFQLAAEEFIAFIQNEVEDILEEKEGFSNENMLALEEEVKQIAEEKGLFLRKSVKNNVIQYTTFFEHDGDLIDSNYVDGCLEGEDAENIKKDHLEILEYLTNRFNEILNEKKDKEDELLDFKNHQVMEISKKIFSDFKDPIVQKHIKLMVSEFIDDFEDLFMDTPPTSGIVLRHEDEDDKFEKYQVNFCVPGQKGNAPVIFLDTPTYSNLFGGVSVGDFSDRKNFNHLDVYAGAIHRANGGYLIFRINDIDNITWETLKRVLTFSRHQISVLNPYIGSFSEKLTDMIDIDVKVVIILEPYIFHMLNHYDSDIDKIFKVRAYFDSSMEIKKENIVNVAKFVKEITNKEKLKPFNKKAVALLLQESVRMAGMKKISTAFSKIRELIIEADFYAQGKVVTEKDLEKALLSRIEHADIFQKKEQEYIDKKIIFINTGGKKVGEMNGLAVIQLPDYSFGVVCRVIATTGMGNKGIINIEKNSNFSDNLYNKAVEIISGYFYSLFAQNFPLVMNGSISFEQSYSRIGGDSATLVDTITLVSSLSDIPIDQGIAVTGSMNKKGEVQPIGGVNEKIEGFFDTCKLQGFTGKQGVIIPKSNVIDLMLRKDIITAVKKGRFHIYAVEKVEEALLIAMGKEAGNLKDDGTYEEGTIYNAVYRKLEKYYNNLKKK